MNTIIKPFKRENYLGRRFKFTEDDTTIFSVSEYKRDKSGDEWVKPSGGYFVPVQYIKFVD